jgi:hypothetical protein|tara:strand:+ start:55 stop:273 length:219 start_codon:yes stop_codon:yes gene_type:complete
MNVTTNKQTIIAALTEARKTCLNNVDMIAAATFSLNTEFFGAVGVTSSEDATEIVAGILYEHTSGLVFEGAE